MNVNGVSCFETKPRRRRYESSTLICDHKTLRLCIASDDRERFLDACKWPTYIRFGLVLNIKATQQSSYPSSDHRSAGHQNSDRDGTSQNVMEQTIIEEYLCDNNGFNPGSKTNGV